MAMKSHTVTVFGREVETVSPSPRDPGVTWGVKIRGGTAKKQRYVEMAFEGSKAWPDGIPIGGTRTVVTEDGMDRVTNSVEDVTGEEMQMLKLFANGQRYISRADKVADAKAKEEARAERALYLDKDGNDNSTMRAQVQQLVKEALSEKDDVIANLKRELAEAREAAKPKRRTRKPKVAAE